MSGTDQDTFFKGKQQLDDFLSNYQADYAAILPTRAEVGSIYKLLTASPIDAERLKHIDTGIGFAKTQVAVQTLCELGLVSLNNGILVGHTSQQKSDLMNSCIYKKLCEGVNQDE